MKHLPNTITIFRIVITPVVLVLLLSGTFWGEFWAFALFVIASISDYLDGKLARHYGVPSRLGQFLDPIADKVLVLGTFTVLWYLFPDIVVWWGVALIAARDLFVTVLRMWAESKGRSLRTLGAAKAKTAAQLTFLIGTLLLLVVIRLPDPIGAGGRWLFDSPFLFWLMMAVVVITLYTGFLYATRMEYSGPASTDPSSTDTPTTDAPNG